MTLVMGTEQTIKREPRRGDRNSIHALISGEFLSPLRGSLLLIDLDSHGSRPGLPSPRPLAARALHSVAPFRAFSNGAYSLWCLFSFRIGYSTRSIWPTASSDLRAPCVSLGIFCGSRQLSRIPT